MSDSIWPYLWALLTGYSLGAISFAVLVARCYGVNILKEGSCSAGATNVRRVIGKFPARLVFFLDFAKGFVAASLPVWLGWGDAEFAPLFGMVGAILGHCFSVWLNFRGGKAIAASMGALMALMPAVVFIAMLVWYGVFLWTRIVAMASMAFACALPILAWLLGAPFSYLLCCGFLALLIIWLHRSNIKRMRDGTEGRYERK